MSTPFTVLDSHLRLQSDLCSVEDLGLVFLSSSSPTYSSYSYFLIVLQTYFFLFTTAQPYSKCFFLYCASVLDILYEDLSSAPLSHYILVNHIIDLFLTIDSWALNNKLQWMNPFHFKNIWKIILYQWFNPIGEVWGLQFSTCYENDNVFLNSMYGKYMACLWLFPSIQIMWPWKSSIIDDSCLYLLRQDASSNSSSA